MRSHCPDISGVGNEGGGGAVTPAQQETPRTLNTGHRFPRPLSRRLHRSLTHSVIIITSRLFLRGELGTLGQYKDGRYCVSRQSGVTQYEMKYGADNDWDI